MALTKINSAGLNINADTASGDDAAVGYTSAEGLIITGQGSTSDVTLKNDADGTVFTVPTGTDEILFPDSAKGMWGAGSDMQLYHDGSNSYITNAVGALKIATETSGIALTIGHTTSETTVADNLTVTGDLAVTGAGQGWVKVSQITLSSAGPFTFSSVFNSTYDIYMAHLDGLHVETDTNSMTMLYDIGGLQTGTYYGYHSQILEGSGDGYAALNDRDGTSIGLLNDIGNASGETVNGLIYFYQPSSTDRIKTSSAHIVCCNTGNDPRGGTSHHNFTNSVAALTGFKLDVASDDFDAGTVTIYGLKN